MAEIALDLWLRGVAFGPFPLLIEIGQERERVEHALDVAARAGIGVPVPGAADITAGLEHMGLHAEAAEFVEHVEACHPRAYDDGIKPSLYLRTRTRGGRHGLASSAREGAHLYEYRPSPAGTKD